MTDPYGTMPEHDWPGDTVADRDPVDTAALDGDPTDAVRVVSIDGTMRHLPSPAPGDPHKQWQGHVTADWVAWLRRGDGPYWLAGDHLVISQGTDAPEEDHLIVRPGEWVTWCGDGYGFELGQVVPVFMRAGWESSEVLAGWVQTLDDVPALLRGLADHWNTDGS